MSHHAIINPISFAKAIPSILKSPSIGGFRGPSVKHYQLLPLISIPTMLLYLVTYDIQCDRRRKKVSDILEGYGKRVQYSVFECLLPAEKYQELQRRLKYKIDVEVDSLRFYPISGHTSDQILVWGGLPIVARPGSIVV
jgi:CRISPR-associated protein Cas2